MRRAGDPAPPTARVDAAEAETIDAVQTEVVRRLARVAEHRDDETGRHTQRVGLTASLLAARLGVTGPAARLLEQAAWLHDIGKVAIPDAILLKPGGLTGEERIVMQAHAATGADMLSDSSLPVLRLASCVAATHHERWDGHGYPRALASSAIPLAGRIVAVADVFDALTQARPYKEAWAVDDAIAEIQAQSGRQFDPEVTRTLTELADEGLVVV
jgi:putative two-component system response regulator